MYISPLIATVFTVGLLLRRANGTGALPALLTGFVLGALRFVAELGVKSEPTWVTWQPLVQYASINFLHVAILLFVISIGPLVFVSLLTAKPTEGNLSVFAPSAVAPAERLAPARRRGINVVLSVLLALIVLMLWTYFSSWIFH